MEKTPIYIRTPLKDERAFNILAGAMSAFDDFGSHVLGREFSAIDAVRSLPQPSQYVVGGKLMIDHYRAALWEFYNQQNGMKNVFTLDLVDNPLVANSGRIVFASSMQNLDLTNGQVVSPNYAAVILSTSPLFLQNESEDRARARAYLLGLHELSHLTLGNQDVCKNEACIVSHPTNPMEGLESKVDLVIKTEKAPICQQCNSKFMDYREKFGL